MTIQEVCCSSCAASARPDETTLVIACTLGTDDFQERVISIRDLAFRHLLSSRREPLALYLTYAAVALPELEDLVAKEADCCAFLNFTLVAGETAELTIRAPEGAALAADELFAYFAPDLARTVS